MESHWNYFLLLGESGYPGLVADVNGDFEGRDVGSGISVIRERTDVVGSGPRLHRHPYRETFVILRGSARFTIGDEQRDGHAGEVLVVAPGTPHKFAVLGPGVYEAVHIHESDHFITEWLE